MGPHCDKNYRSTELTDDARRKCEVLPPPEVVATAPLRGCEFRVGDGRVTTDPPPSVPAAEIRRSSMIGPFLAG